MRASDAIPLNHSRDGDPEHCCSGGRHNYHFRPGASMAPGCLIWCCCKSVLSEIEPENPDPAAARISPARLREAREYLGFHRADVAAALGWEVGQVEDIESGG